MRAFASNINPDAAVVQTFSVPNAELGSSVIVSPRGSLPDGIILSYARVSEAGVVEVKFYNASMVAKSPALTTYDITVIK
jgi:hypothetical protein